MRIKLQLNQVSKIEHNRDNKKALKILVKALII